ncbi:hypothetical protein IWQ56_001034 [Coemansia nantahalensis]|nr:hypothetical protein IWQ56_001034 [Coemansia nantahalensis]
MTTALGSDTAAQALHAKARVVDARCAGQKLRNFIVHEFRDVLRIRADALHALRDKRVRVNGEITLDSHVLAIGDVVRIEVDSAHAMASRLHSIDVAVRHAEPGLMVLLKAPGVKRHDVEWAAGALAALADRESAQTVDIEQLSPWIAINEVEKSVRSLIVLVDGAEHRAAMEDQLRSGEMEFTLCAVCHGSVDQIAVDAAAVPGSAEATGLACRIRVTVDRTISSLGAGQLSLVRAAVSATSSPGLALRRFMEAADRPVAGWQKHTKPLENHRDKGTLLAFVGIEFPSPAAGGQRVAVTEGIPQKLLSVCEREAKFYDRRLTKTRAEVERVRTSDLAVHASGPSAEDGAHDWDVEMVNGRPAAYITGTKEFCGHAFRVTPDTLIPRQSTEVLARATAGLLGTGAPRILDLGTGSGCVLLAVLLHHGSATGAGVDISAAALEVARSNCERHGLSQRVALLSGSFETFAADPAIASCGPFDVIACNPPYLAPWRAARMRTAIEHEPELALVAGDGGYQAYSAICQSLRTNPAILRPGGCIAFEIGKGMEKGVRAIFAEWTETQALRDAYGFLRVLVFQRP